MPYDPLDPRSSLAAPGAVASGGGPLGQGTPAVPECIEFRSRPPDQVSALGSKTWIVRSQTAVVAYTEAVAGDELRRIGQVDEYIALFVSTPTRRAGRGAVTAGTDRQPIRGDAVAIVPSGGSSVSVAESGVVVRVFSNRSTDLLDAACNAAAHLGAHPFVAPFAAWPPAPAGEQLRVYPLGDLTPEPGRFGNIYRCTTVMVNVLPPDPGPRDPSRLSPHHHDDFEQLSLQIDGDYVHHLRVTWTPDMNTWRDDQHLGAASPALTVIPPPLVHTSQGVGGQRHQLIDIFCPPRLDFSLKPGWVLNAADYPDLPSLPATRG